MPPESASVGPWQRGYGHRLRGAAPDAPAGRAPTKEDE